LLAKKFWTIYVLCLNKLLYHIHNFYSLSDFAKMIKKGGKIVGGFVTCEREQKCIGRFG
jgi:hypothetical protein